MPEIDYTYTYNFTPPIYEIGNDTPIRRTVRAVRRTQSTEQEVESRPIIEGKFFESEAIKDLDKTTFNKMRFKRRFGIELEVDERNIDYEAIRNETNFGSKYDGSLSEGTEFFSPILQGDIGYNQIKTICKYLRGKKINYHCGYHVHFDGQNIRWHGIQKIWALYHILEPILLGLLPESRQGNNYCRKISELKSFNYIIDCNSEDELYNEWYLDSYDEDGDAPCEHRWNETRYRGFNLHAWWFQGTIEIRYHTGTTDFKKVMNWILINQYIIEYALKNSLDKIKTLKMAIDKLGELNLEKNKIILKNIIKSKKLIKYYEERYVHFRKVDRKRFFQKLREQAENLMIRNHFEEQRRLQQDEEGYTEIYMRQYGNNINSRRTTTRREASRTYTIDSGATMRFFNDNNVEVIGIIPSMKYERIINTGLYYLCLNGIMAVSAMDTQGNSGMIHLNDTDSLMYDGHEIFFEHGEERFKVYRIYFC